MPPAAAIFLTLGSVFCLFAAVIFGWSALLNHVERERTIKRRLNYAAISDPEIDVALAPRGEA